MNKQEVLDKLKIDEHYYGDFGKQYLSNSDIMALLNNPLALINSNQENLFVMGQLQDYFIQNLDGEQNFQEVSMRGFSSEDYNITASVSNATFIVGRGPSSRGIDI